MASSNKSPPPLPVLRTTSYEQVSSGLMAIIAALVAAVLFLSTVWYASRTPVPPVVVPVELVESPGGSEDGSVDETLRVDSPAPPSPDASLADVIADETEVQASLESVVGFADNMAGGLADETQKQVGLGTRNAGKPGSAQGTGRRALGSGTGLRGFPREQRWFVRFGDSQSVDEYARQLDFFGIELGAIANGKLNYVSRLSTPTPIVRTADSGAGEKRLYMTWQGGTRKQADLQLFRKARIEVGAGAIFHFYAKDTEDKLARLELAYKNRKADEIRRTYFAVKSAGTGYDFEVIRQTYLK